MWHWALDLDRWLFGVCNKHLNTPFMDELMPFMRASKHWYPLYVIILIISWRLGKWQALWALIITGAITIMISDAIVANGLKHLFERLRPCNNPEMHARLLLPNCGSGYSFVSAHATNHMALAWMFGSAFRRVFRYGMGIAVIWAATISFAQVYCGVHYPSDVICGAFLGAMVGYITSKYIFSFFYKKPVF